MKHEFSPYDKPKGYYTDELKKKEPLFGILTKKQESDLENATELTCVEKVPKGYVSKKSKEQSGCANTFHTPCVFGEF